MTSKNDTQNLNTTGRNITSENTTSNKKNTYNNNKNSIDNTRNYVSGDSARSSSSHTFHKNTSDESSV